MSRELPFPITFELPDGWTLVPPEASGRADAACVAVRDADTAGPVATNIVISGLGVHGAAVDVAALASAQLTNLHQNYAVTVLRRDVTPDAPAPQAAHLLQIEYPHGESATTVRQIRIVTAFAGPENPADVAVLQLVMTCPVEVFDDAGREFGRFVASIAPAASTGATSKSEVGEQIPAAATLDKVDRQPGPTGV